MTVYPPNNNAIPRIVQDIWDAILNDKWMWIVVWGKPRTGKTTVQMQLAYAVYKDWEKVLRSFAWTLSGLLYKMEKGEPERIWTYNKLHNRIPLLIYDDWGAHSNKAETQYEKAWDIFKGGFDVLGTEVAVIVASMVTPDEPTFQIASKFTHEIYIPTRGVYKYDEIDWSQDYHGWKPTRRKQWIETQNFCESPSDVYKQYDEQRMALVQDVKQRIKDAIVESGIESTLKRLQPIDVELMSLMNQKGQIPYRAFTELDPKYKEALIRCKARNLVVPVRKHDNYWYDLTDFGAEVLKAVQQSKDQGAPTLTKTTEITHI